MTMRRRLKAWLWLACQHWRTVDSSAPRVRITITGV
jgi:hypothetical protein